MACRLRRAARYSAQRGLPNSKQQRWYRGIFHRPLRIVAEGGFCIGQKGEQHDDY